MAAFGYAGEGLRDAFRSQRNFRIHLAFAMAVTALCIWLRLPPVHTGLLALTIGAVLVTEVLNSALEALVDLVSPDYHPLAKRVKDLMAASVLLAALSSVVVGLVILGPPLLALVGLR